jgi:acyl dehydratase
MADYVASERIHERSADAVPINPEAVGARSRPVRRAWTSGDALIYAVGVGAGSEDPSAELAFTTENSAGVTQRVLPTMAVVLGGRTGGIFRELGPYDSSKVVHAEQYTQQHREIPVEGELESVTEIVGIYDKQRYAKVVSKTVGRLVGSGEPLFTNIGSVFIRGEGGWGGDTGPSGNAAPMPERAADCSVGFTIPFNQALVYRLSGDHNPLHADPSFAAGAGFARPILHGLCTFGFAGRFLLRELCDSDPAQARAMKGRFSTPVYPGDSMTVNIWRTSDGDARFQVVHADGRVAIDRGQFSYEAQ